MTILKKKIHLFIVQTSGFEWWRSLRPYLHVLSLLNFCQMINRAGRYSRLRNVGQSLTNCLRLWSNPKAKTNCLASGLRLLQQCQSPRGPMAVALHCETLCCSFQEKKICWFLPNLVENTHLLWPLGQLRPGEPSRSISNRLGIDQCPLSSFSPSFPS